MISVIQSPQFTLLDHNSPADAQRMSKMQEAECDVSGVFSSLRPAANIPA